MSIEQRARLNPKLRKAMRRYGDEYVRYIVGGKQKLYKAESALIDVIREMLVQATIKADATSSPNWQEGLSREAIADALLYESGDEK